MASCWRSSYALASDVIIYWFKGQRFSKNFKFAFEFNVQTSTLNNQRTNLHGPANTTSDTVPYISTHYRDT